MCSTFPDLSIRTFNNTKSPKTLNREFPEWGRDARPLVWSTNLRWSFADTSTTWFFRISHDTPIMTIVENQLVRSTLRSHNCSLEVDDIQHPSRVVTGQLLGPVPQDFTLKAIRKKLLRNPAFSNKTHRQFSLVSDLYKINEERVEASYRTQVVTIVTTPALRDQLSIIFRGLYPARPRSAYIHGIHWRFLPDLSQPSFPVTSDHISLAMALRLKQQEFLKTVQTCDYAHVRNLNRTLDDHPSAHLHSLLMSLKSVSQPDTNLFLMVEQEFQVSNTKFTFTPNMANEARAIIPVLPLILKEKYGQSVSQWFQSSAFSMLSEFSVDLSVNKVISSSSNEFNDVFQFWDVDVPSSGSGVHTQGKIIIDFGDFDISPGTSRKSNLEGSQESLGPSKTSTSMVSILSSSSSDSASAAEDNISTKLQSSAVSEASSATSNASSAKSNPSTSPPSEDLSRPSHHEDADSYKSSLAEISSVEQSLHSQASSTKPPQDAISSEHDDESSKDSLLDYVPFSQSPDQMDITPSPNPFSAALTHLDSAPSANPDPSSPAQEVNRDLNTSQNAQLGGLYVLAQAGSSLSAQTVTPPHDSKPQPKALPKLREDSQDQDQLPPPPAPPATVPTNNHQPSLTAFQASVASSKNEVPNPANTAPPDHPASSSSSGSGTTSAGAAS